MSNDAAGTAATKVPPLPSDTQLSLDAPAASLRLGPASELDFPGWVREGLTAEGQLLRVIELPGAEEPSWLSTALALPQTAEVAARTVHEGHLCVVLSAPEGPTLDRLILRGGSDLFSLLWINTLVQLFAAIHAAGLLFRRVSPGSFSLRADGTLRLDEPELLRPTDQGVEEGATVFTAPEVVLGAAADARSDQFSLGILAYALLSHAIPFQADALPPIRTYCPALPHGIESALSRALHLDPAQRFDDCLAFGEALNLWGLPLGRRATRIRLGSATEIGRLKKQSMPVNQDARFVGYDDAIQRGLILVADGVSTADVSSGDQASAKVFEATRDAWEGPVGEILRTHTGEFTDSWCKTVLEAILDDANARIFSILKQPIFVGALDPTTHPPGSTALLGLLDGDRLTLATLGDSRVYLLRKGAIEQLSVDQTLYTTFVQEKRDPRSAADPDALCAITHCVGNFFFDHDGGISIRKLEPRLLKIQLKAGDRLLLCSDGVPDCLGDGALEVMARELGSNKDAEAIATALCQQADAALGADNITAVVLQAD